MIEEEEGYMILLQFEMTKKGLSYAIGFDDEVEVAVTEDKFDEGIYFQESTIETTHPIAPNDFRKSILNIPLMTERKPIKFTATPSSKPKAK
jgi:hypothetical protein